MAEIMQGRGAPSQLRLSNEADALFYRRWFQDVPSRPAEKALVHVLLLEALTGVLATGSLDVSALEDKEIEERLARGCSAAGQAEPSEGELWEWASAASASFVARTASVTIGALGHDHGAERRSSLRHRKECCVCARAKWAQEMEEVFFFRTPEGECEDALVADIEKGGAAVPVQEDAAGPEAVAAAGEGSRRQLAQEMFSPERYHGRWSYSLPGHEGLGNGGISDKIMDT